MQVAVFLEHCEFALETVRLAKCLDSLIFHLTHIRAEVQAMTRKIKTRWSNVSFLYFQMLALVLLLLVVFNFLLVNDTRAEALEASVESGHLCELLMCMRLTSYTVASF